MTNLRSIGLPVPETERTMIDVRGPKTQVGRFILLCRTIQYLCYAGATRTITIEVDGDGPANLAFVIDPRFKDIQAGDIDTDNDPVRLPGISND